MSFELQPEGMQPEDTSAPNGDTVHNQEAQQNDISATTVINGNDADSTAEPSQPVDVPVSAEPQQDGVGLVEEQLERPFSWLDPHPMFVILLVGKDETPFGIQRDFLAAKSTYYMQYFKQNQDHASIENIVKLPDTDPAVFAFAQSFMYTGQVFPNIGTLPSYEILISLWKLGHELGIDGLCDATLDAMTEYRRVTYHIPATPLLVQVWQDTPEGSSIRKLLLSWAAEYMRSSDSRAEFARSLPQEVLSELVVAMSNLDAAPTTQDSPMSLPTAAALAEAAIANSTVAQRRNASHLDAAEDEAATRPAKKQRHSVDLGNGSTPASTNTKSAARKSGSRASLPSGKGGNKRKSNIGLIPGSDSQPFSANQRLNFCADLLTRMLSGPGFWTRLVGPFKEPVNPVDDGVPDYLDKVTKPMDLGTMKAKMDRHEYADELEFLADMNQIFTNCYTYWTDKHPMWAACERLQKTFEEKYSQMNKWISKMEGDEGN